MQKELEAIVRDHGAVPATVGVHCGSLHVGLDMKSLEHLAQVGSKAAKISRRDLPAALSKGLSGGTTVAATMVACNRAGIQVFATGGIGGVHRGGEFTLDISPDVMELGRSPVTVVSSGIKSILDIGRTLEVLVPHVTAPTQPPIAWTAPIAANPWRTRNNRPICFACRIVGHVARAADLTGNAVTPFILQKLTERTAGATLRASILWLGFI
ncbi:hypothetical protein HPB50_004619 [Hyalomma asiaticum]|uniref:Uncharacterized protein n=1 Tax=Hyalomma asiaticum TaxID=266040 RepID=A0ACB7SN69_HYAAI|nr:hypothetical protein HPB50_004619 [Hyalomma asiaticum]